MQAEQNPAQSDQVIFARRLDIGEIIDALDVLESNPLIDRPTATGNRELVIGRRSHGYLALYRYVTEIDTVFVLGVRIQREAGYLERSE